VKIEYAPTINLDGTGTDNLEEFLAQDRQNLLEEVDEKFREVADLVRRSSYD
jgi:hypothetical protein